MKNKILVVKNIKEKVIISILITILAFLVVSCIQLKQKRKILNPELSKMQGIRNREDNESERKVFIRKNNIPYNNIPKEIEGYTVIGRVSIPRIGIKSDILSETTDKSLDISVTKLEGPEINQMGNFCITGHNYFKNNMFGKLRDVEIGDKIVLEDIYGETLTYKVYKIEKVSPKEVRMLISRNKW